MRNVSANGNYRTVPFTLTTPGKYSWKLAYSGDANNVPQFTTCSDPANQVTFTPAPVVTPMTVTAGPAAVEPGDALIVSWSGVTSPTAADWIGLYPVGGTSPVAWRYTGGTASGSTSMTVPTTLPAGTYEVRLRSVSSSVVTVN